MELFALLSLAFAVGAPRPALVPAPDFAREVRPILSTHCFTCHGQDAKKRQAGLRLDTSEGAYGSGSSGRIALVPGKPEASELMRRITATDARRMPPASHSKTLTTGEAQTLRRWIASGGKYVAHWAFTPPKPQSIPKLDSDPRTPEAQRLTPNPIDAFIRARLAKEGLKPSPEADRATLIRRVTLDLTGLPPTPAEVDAYLNDKAPGAYERVVDRLLASPRYGERMAVEWLDLARYADSNGYQVDRDREMWPWRDWVIRALNTDMPFDQFTIEQLAGDLLPNATLEQRTATGFNRNHMLNEEGGIIPEEFLAEYVADRTETTASVWLGLTMGCARCHDHKYDPFTQREYYQLFAYYNSIAEQGVGNYGAPPKLSAPPLLQLPSAEQKARLEQLQRALTELRDAAAKKDQSPEARKADDAKAAAIRKEKDALDLQIPTLMVMSELPKPRDTFILVRGQYNRKGDPVQPGTPASLGATSKDLPSNRLGLAKWLVDPRNPLTARVVVNRAWQMHFGTGLVRTAEDFGTQGELPSHPELLDWLALKFTAETQRTQRETEAGLGWSLKRLHRLIVTSSTYKQTSTLPIFSGISESSASLRFKLNPRSEFRTPNTVDPENRLLWRGPRLRLPAEIIRDQALSASGLLVEKLGGPSVKPYHPAGLYEQIASTTPTYVQDHGEGLYRRSLYTYWRRSIPNPAMLAFDVPFRETCTLRRARTSTPLQALNLLNDPTYVEAQRALGARMIREGGGSPRERVAYGFRLVLARTPAVQELTILTRTLDRMLGDYRTDPKAAEALLKVGESPLPDGMDKAELAAYAFLAGTLLNLDETITRE